MPSVTGCVLVPVATGMAMLSVCLSRCALSDWVCAGACGYRRGHVVCLSRCALSDWVCAGACSYRHGHVVCLSVCLGVPSVTGCVLVPVATGMVMLSVCLSRCALSDWVCAGACGYRHDHVVCLSV